MSINAIFNILMYFVMLNKRIWANTLNAIDVQLDHIPYDFSFIRSSDYDSTSGVILDQVLINVGLWLFAETIDAYQSVELELWVENLDWVERVRLHDATTQLMVVDSAVRYLYVSPLKQQS